MKYWRKLTHEEQSERISKALSENINYSNTYCLGIPASRLDPEVFYEQAPFLKDAPWLRSYVQNPNHIGCHTLGDSETFFKGTQEIEREVIDVLSVDLLKADSGSCDGYIAAGGTEANIQAAWIYRNYFMKEFNAKADEIVLTGSEDTHYSMDKAANLLGLKCLRIPVDFMKRNINEETLDEVISKAVASGIRYFIVFSNKGSTMFGSIDDPDLYADVLSRYPVQFKIHVDAAFGGFIISPDDKSSNADFSNANVSSITLDAHKMLQAPYGTGIFLIRKGLMEHVMTREAQYVNGMDITLSGSRSGANAIAVWMILFTYGPFGWLEKINKLIYRTRLCCSMLDTMKIRYYNREGMNIVTLLADDVPEDIANKYRLVPDTHSGNAKWYKIVIMDHVEIEHLKAFVSEI